MNISRHSINVHISTKVFSQIFFLPLLRQWRLLLLLPSSSLVFCVFLQAPSQIRINIACIQSECNVFEPHRRRWERHTQTRCQVSMNKLNRFTFRCESFALKFATEKCVRRIRFDRMYLVPAFLHIAKMYSQQQTAHACCLAVRFIPSIGYMRQVCTIYLCIIHYAVCATSAMHKNVSIRCFVVKCGNPWWNTWKIYVREIRTTYMPHSLFSSTKLSTDEPSGSFLWTISTRRQQCDEWFDIFCCRRTMMSDVIPFDVW